MLRHDDSNNTTTTATGAVLNLVNTIVGAGAIGYGGAVAASGGVASLVTVALVAVLTKRSLDMVIAAGLIVGGGGGGAATTTTTIATSLEGVGRAAYGRLGVAAVVGSKGLFTFGCMVAYLVIVKETLGPAVRGLILGGGFDDDDNNNDTSNSAALLLLRPRLLTIGLAVTVVLPLCCLRNISSLEAASSVKLVAYAGIAAIVT